MKPEKRIATEPDDAPAPPRLTDRLDRWAYAMARGAAAMRAALPGSPLPAASRWEERTGTVVAAAAVLWMFLVAVWGLIGPFPAGHFAATASIGTAAYNMLRYHILYPVLYNPMPPGPPTAGSYYMHHPVGIYWVTAALMKVLGDHNAVVRLPAIIYSTATPIFLYRLGRVVWGPLAGALTAVAFVSLPLTLGFANFHAPDGPTIFGWTVAGWGYARFVQSWRTRYAFVALAGLVFATQMEWLTYVWAAQLLLWFFLRAFVFPPTWFGPAPARAAGRFWGMLVMGAVVSFGFSIALIIDSGKLSDLLSAYSARSAGSGPPLKAVLASRHHWIALMFPGAAVFLGKLAVPIIVARLYLRRNELEGLALAFLAAAIFHYVHFKQGADIHIFWSHYFAPYFALAVGALAATAIAGAKALAPRLRGRAGEWMRRWAPAAGAGLVALPVLFVFQDGARTIRLARESGGRYLSSDIESDVDKVEALRWFVGRAPIPPTATINFHSGISSVHWALLWETHPRPLTPNKAVKSSAPSERFYFIDTRFAPSVDLKTAAATYHVNSLDHFWLVDRSQPASPLTGYRFDEQDPSLWQSFLRGATEPLRRVAPDPWSEWEWRTLLGQPATAPKGTTATWNQIRIAHNLAVETADKAGETRQRQTLEKLITDRPNVAFDNGTQLLGIIRHRGAERALTLLFLAGDFKGARCSFPVRATVVRGPRFSTLPRDPTEIVVSMPPEISTDLWRPGRIYAAHFAYRKRPGTERFTGRFVSLDGKPAPSIKGAKLIEAPLLTL